MRLANILGLLGLLAIVALIIIYIIKPNFQQKFVSSTFVWKLSLKYKKKRIPISKLRNVLLVLCQILILTTCAFILAKPEVEADKREDNFERVYIVDASANMMAISREVGGEYSSRYERALRELRAQVNEVLNVANGRVTIILAKKNAEYFEFNNGVDAAKQVMGLGRDIDEKAEDNENLIRLNNALDDLIDRVTPTSAGTNTNLPLECYYGNADIVGAMELAEKRMLANRDTEVFLITGKEYPEVDSLNVINIGDEEVEKNVAILDGSLDINGDGAYSFSVDIVSYGKATELVLEFVAEGIGYDPTIIKENNGDDYKDDNLYFSTTLRFDEPDVVQRFTLDTWHEFFVKPWCEKNIPGYDESNPPEDLDERMENVEPSPSDENNKKIAYSFKRIGVRIANANDALSYDNEYWFFGGYKPKISVLYSSTKPNPFIKAAMNVCQDEYGDRWTIDYRESAKAEFELGYEQGLYNAGIDMFIFEHYIPDEIEDIASKSIVYLIDPIDNGKTDGLGISNVERIGNANANASGGGLLGPSDQDHIPWGSRHFIEATAERHPIIAHLENALKYSDDEMRLAVTKYSRFDVSDDFRVLLNVNNGSELRPMMAINKNSDIIVLGCDLNGSNFPRLPAFPEMMMDIFDYLFPDVITKYNYFVGETVVFNTLAAIKEKNDPNSIFASASEHTLDEFGLFSYQQTLKSDNKIDIDFFVQIPNSESDIFNIGGEKIEGPRVNVTKETQYDDLLIWFAAALVALLFAEWLLQARENF